MKIDIIGAGPAGCYLAYLLAKKGNRVILYDKKPKIGYPVQCTGILSDYFLTIMQPREDFVLNTVDKARIYSPDGKYIEVKIKKNYVICRKKFDSYLGDLAKDAGVKIKLGHSFHSLKKFQDVVISNLGYNGKKINSKADFLIGADGPLSPVAKAAGIFGERQFLIGTQIETHLKNDNVVEFYPYIGSYAWIVPVNQDVVRIGVAGYKNTVKLFKDFAKKRIGKDFDKRTIENQSGIIPIFNPKIRLKKDNILLVGDAATFIKATTGGGINQGIKAAKILSDSFESYEKKVKKEIYPNLYAHLFAHEMMKRFSERDWNNLIKDFSDIRLKKILSDESRDNIIKMLIRIVSVKPSLLRYSVYFPFKKSLSLF